MTDYCPYCFLYENSGNLFVSTVVQLPANKDLGTPALNVNGNTTTVTYAINNSLGLPAGIRTPADEQIAWDGTERIVKVVVNDGQNNNSNSMNSEDID
jgi:hypothetical protein